MGVMIDGRGSIDQHGVVDLGIRILHHSCGENDTGTAVEELATALQLHVAREFDDVADAGLTDGLGDDLRVP